MLYSTSRMWIAGFAMLVLSLTSACGSTDTPSTTPKLAETTGALGGGTLSDNRDRLFLSYAARRGYAGNPCALWTAMNSSEKGTFFTITHRLWEATVQSTGLRALTHIKEIYSIMGAGTGCGGPDDNRLFMRMGPPLKEAFIAASNGAHTALNVLGNGDSWAKSHDIAGPHTPFNASSETVYGGPTGQAHFWTMDAVPPACRADFKSQCITDPFLLEVDQDYNWKHDSNTECKYGGWTGRAIYASKHPGVNYEWVPLSCNPEQASCGDGTCQKSTEDCGKCPEDCTCMPGVTGCWPNGQGNHACLKLPGCTTTADCDLGECIAGACLMNCGDGYCNRPTEDCDSCKEDCGCIIEGFEACNPVTGLCDPSAPVCGDGICSEGVCGACHKEECQCPVGSSCGCLDGESECEQEVCIRECEEGPCNVMEDLCECEQGMAVTFCGDGKCSPTEGCATCPVDCPCKATQACHGPANACYACGDGVCAPNMEDCSGCPQDCSCPSAEVCVNHQCLAGPVPCGDNICDPTEDCGVCEVDCNCLGDEQCVYHQCLLIGAGIIPTHCGNGYCDDNHEHCGNCPADCHCPDGEGCVQGQCSSDAEACGDGSCAPGFEDCGNCLKDCPCPSNKECVQHQCVAGPASCGDGSCDPSSENCGNCPFDCDCPIGEQCQNFECAILEACGDDTCDLALENCANCPDDCFCPQGTLCKNAHCVAGTTSCGDGQCQADQEGCGVCPSDCPCPDGKACTNNQCMDAPNDCGDGQCKGGEEDCGNCPDDCPCPGGQQCQNNQCVENGQNDCGDGQCKGGEENCGNCPADCPCPNGKTCQNNQCVDPGPSCGDGSCNGTEHCHTCPVDCPCAAGEICEQGMCVEEPPA